MNDSERHRPASGSLVALAVAILFLTACCLLVLDPLKYEVATAMAGGSAAGSALMEALSAHRLTLSGWSVVGLAFAGALVLGEIRARRLSEGLQGASRPQFVLLLFALLVWFGQAYLYPGHLLSGDSSAHIVRIAHFGDGLRDGRVLFWDNHFYTGAPFLQFYAPLFFWIGGAFVAITGSVDFAVKLVLLACHVGGGLAMFAFLRAGGLSRVGALIGAIAYAGAWAHGHLILYNGALPQALIMLFLPLLFYLVERSLHRPPRFDSTWLGIALCTGALGISHQPHALFAGGYLALYLAGRIRVADRRIERLAVMAVAGALGVAMALFAVAPFLREKPWVMAETRNSFFELRIPTLEYLGKLALWSNAQTSTGSQSAAYLGASVILLALFGAFAWATRPEMRRALPLAGVVILCAGASLVWRGALVRDVMFTLFFFAALAAIGTEHLLSSRPGSGRVALALTALVFLDLGPTAIQPLARADKHHLDAAGRELAGNVERVIVGNTRRSNGEGGAIQLTMGPGGGVIEYYNVQTLSGPHNHAAPLAHNYALGMLGRLERDLRASGRIGDSTLSLLRLFNVGYIVNDRGDAMGLPDSIVANHEGDPLGRALRIERATPAVWAPRVERIEGADVNTRPMLWREEFVAYSGQVARLDSYLEAVVTRMEFAPDSRTAQRLPLAVEAGAAAERCGNAPPADSPALMIHSVAVTHDRVALAVAVPACGFLQLSHPWYPTLAVKVDGMQVDALRGALGQLVVPVEAGSKSITIEPQRSEARVVFGWASAAALLSSLVIPLVAGIVRRRDA